jgi:hypothetical protein
MQEQAMFLDYLELAITLASIAIGISMVRGNPAGHASAHAPRKETQS